MSKEVLTFKEGNSKVFFDAYAQLFKMDKPMQVLTAFSTLQLLYASEQGQELKPQEPPMMLVVGRAGVGKTIRLNAVMSLWGMPRYYHLHRYVLTNDLPLPLGYDIASISMEDFLLALRKITNNVIILTAEPRDALVFYGLYQKHYAGQAGRLVVLKLDDDRESMEVKNRLINFMCLTQTNHGHIDLYEQYLKDHMNEFKGYVERAKGIVKDELLSLITAFGMSFADFLRSLGYDVELELKAFSDLNRL